MFRKSTIPNRRLRRRVATAGRVAPWSFAVHPAALDTRMDDVELGLPLVRLGQGDFIRDYRPRTKRK